MITRHFKTLDVPLERLIKKDAKLYRMPADQLCSARAFDPKELLKEDVYSLLSELGHLAGLLFEQRPGAEKDNIHIDYDKVSKRPFWPCLNLILEGQGVLRWHRPVGPGELRTAGGNIYMAWNKECYGQIIDEWSSGKVALVRTDIPHNAFNFDKETRLSISIRWSKRYTWNETLAWFNKVFLERINLQPHP